MLKNKCKERNCLEGILLLEICCACVDTAAEIAMEVLDVPEAVNIATDLVSEIVDDDDIVDELLEYALYKELA